jgi:MFS family permease
VVFATYVAGVLAALLVFGRWSDVVGRHPMLLLAIAFTVGSAAVFLVATGVDDLLLRRVLSGLSAGVATGTATAAVIESCVGELARPCRGEVGSTYFVVAYIGISLRVIGEGLAAETWGLRAAGIVFALAVAGLTAACLAQVLVR